MFPKGGVLGDFDVDLLGRVGGVVGCLPCSTKEESEDANDVDVGVPRDRTASDVATRGGGCSGRVSLSRSQSNLMPALWSVDKSVLRNEVRPANDDWLVEAGKLREASVLCVVNVFKYFCVDAERELRGVAPVVRERDTDTLDILDKGLRGEMQERPLCTNDTIGGTSLPGPPEDADRDGKETTEDKSLDTNLTGVGVTGDVTKETGPDRSFPERNDELTGVTGDVIREWWARETLGDCHVELVGVVWEATSCGLKSAVEDGWVTLDTG